MLSPLKNLIRRSLTVAVALIVIGFLCNGVAIAESANKKKPITAKATISPSIFAIVGSTTISPQEFQVALQRGMRAKFYHGKPKEGQVAQFQREVGEKLVRRVLMLQEAKKRGLTPDKEKTEEKLDQLEAKYSKSPNWEEIKKNAIPNLKRHFDEDSLLEILENNVRAIPDPDDAATKKYFDSHPEKFTEPEKVRVSVILLKVDPSSSNEVWDAAMKEGGDIVKRLRDGADFAELAKIHSGDQSASKGGDMGYLHKGMLAEPVQKAVDELKKGEISEPLVLLQGIAIFRLDDRKEAKRVSFSKAKERARKLLKRELSDKKWNDLSTRLRNETNVQINESHYLPLPAKKAQGQGDDKG